jgi:hypothetical protein
MGDPNISRRWYEIRMAGHLSAEYWSQWFEGLTVTFEQEQTVITGPLADQAALFGLLNRIRDLDMPLVLVKRLRDADEDQ